MKTIKRVVLVAAIAAASLVAQQYMTCPADDAILMFTGQTQIANGHILQLWHCNWGHYYWVRIS